MQHLQCITNFKITYVCSDDKQWEWCTAAVNRNTTPQPVETFVARVVEKRGALVVKDTLADTMFDDHALKQVFRCWIGCPNIPPGT